MKIILLLVVMVTFGWAQQPKKQPPPVKPANRTNVALTGQTNVPPPQNQPTVTQVVGINRAGLGDEITVEVKPLQPLLDRANCVNIQSNCTKQNVALFLNGMPLRGISPVSDIHNETLRYPLQRTDDTKDVWSALLGAPKATVRTVSVSVGLENEYPVATQVTKFQLIVLRAGWSLVALGIVLLMVVAIFILAARSALLRDPGPAEAASDDTVPWGRKVKRKVMVPYSLGRVQMAFWFLLVVASFLFIWVTTGQHDTLSAQALALIGIGTGTALGSALIDANKKEQSQSAVTSLEAEKVTPRRKLRRLQMS